MSQNDIKNLSNEELQGKIERKYGEDFTLDDLDPEGDIEKEFLERLENGF